MGPIDKNGYHLSAQGPKRGPGTTEGPGTTKGPMGQNGAWGITMRPGDHNGVWDHNRSLKTARTPLWSLGPM